MTIAEQLHNSKTHKDGFDPNCPKCTASTCGCKLYFGYGSFTCGLASGHLGEHKERGNSWKSNQMVDYAHDPR